jgi:hypothetical protein
MGFAERSPFFKHYGSPFLGKSTARGGSRCDQWVETLVMVREGLLARPIQDGQQASIHIGIEAGVGKVGCEQK